MSVYGLPSCVLTTDHTGIPCATLQMTTSPEVLSQASRCPYIQKVVAETGDPQTVR